MQNDTVEKFESISIAFEGMKVTVFAATGPEVSMHVWWLCHTELQNGRSMERLHIMKNFPDPQVFNAAYTLRFGCKSISHVG